MTKSIFRPKKALNGLLLLTTLSIAGCVSTSSTVTTDFYTVRGQTSQQIDRDLRRKGPLKGHALASAAIRFTPVSVLQAQSADGCRFSTAKFKVIANITLPRWQDRNATDDRNLRRAWDGLATYAKLHEETHVKIAEIYAQKLGSTLMALPPQKTCSRLDKQAEKVVGTISREHDRAQKTFDAREQARLARLFKEAERRSRSQS
ncbi:MAG: DUF922 domain-containing protein [Ahrensia sp.]|nr:DUF922 domain-containing protein [Ahrensia sp.]